MTTRTFTRDMPDRSRIVAIASDERGYFSLTGELYEPKGTWSGAVCQRNGREWDTGGCIHDEILRAFPRLAPFARLHLADASTGEPMHASANGWYWYASYDGAGTNMTEHQRRGRTDREICAEHLRIPLDQLPDGLDRDAFYAFVETLREQWIADTAAARKILN